MNLRRQNSDEGKDRRSEPGISARLLGRALSISFGRLAIAFFLAGVMWFTANYETDLEKDVEIPVNYLNLPAGLVISNRPYLPSDAKLRIKGTRSQVSAVLKTNAAINIDLSGEGVGIFSRAINSESVSLPRNVRIVRMSPSEIVLDIDTILEKFVSVRADIGQPAAGYRIEGAPVVSPLAARIRGPKKIAKDITEVTTVPISIEREKSKFSVDAALISPDSRIEMSETKTVKVTVDIVEVDVEKTFQNLEVEIRGVGQGRSYEIEPKTADIRFYGPLSVINSLHGDDIVIYADAKSARLAEGEKKLTPLRHNYPEDGKTRVTKITPEKVTIKRLRTEKK